MSKTYYSVLTTYGAQLFAQAMTNRQQVRITQFAVGDSGGRAVTPDSTRTSLVRQVHRANVSAVSTDPRNNRQVIFELTIPENIGGFWIREMGIYDAQNRLVAYANCPDTYKPRLEEGSGKVQVMRMILLVSSSNAVTLTVDDSVIFATRGQLTPKTITASSQNGVDDTGHSHQIDRASTTQAGIVQLDSSTTSPSETKAATLKAVKTVKDLADSNARSLQNVIPNSKKSNSVISTSSDTVATSYAVKQAYDKATEAKNRADSSYQVDNTNQNRNLTQLLGQNTVWGTAGRERSTLGLPASIYNYGVGLSMTSAGARAMLYIPHSTSDRNSGVWVQTNYSGNNAAPLWRRIDGADWGEIRNKVSASTRHVGITQLDNSINSNDEDKAATPKAVKTANDNANGRVSKSGDTMTGVLKINRASCYILGQHNDNNKWYLGKGSDNSDDVAFHNYTYNYGIKLKSDRVESGKRFYVGANAVPHSGDNYLNLSTENYGGISIERANRQDRMLIESHGDQFAFIRRNRSNNENHYVIKTPAKGGTVLLDNDVTYQKSNGFEIRKYPDGTMIQTYVFEQRDILPEAGEKNFTWAVAFVGRPLMFGQITTSYDSDHDCGVNILSKSTNARVYYRFYEHGHPNQGLCRVQFLAIGRWK